MSVITDVPQTGIYYQQNAIVEIIVTLIDVQTGLPINLQAATQMEIAILLPDGITTKTFQAGLYTDGTDGNISYVTQDGDLNQWGLYQMQGLAVIGGIFIPPSYFTDFYVLKNILGQIVPTADYLTDEDGNVLTTEDGTKITHD